MLQRCERMEKSGCWLGSTDGSCCSVRVFPMQIRRCSGCACAQFVHEQFVWELLPLS